MFFVFCNVVVYYFVKVEVTEAAFSANLGTSEPSSEAVIEHVHNDEGTGYAEISTFILQLALLHIYHIYLYMHGYCVHCIVTRWRG